MRELLGRIHSYMIPFPFANAAGHDRNMLNFNKKNKNIFFIKNRK